MTPTPSPTLLLSSRHTEDSQLLWRAAIRRGWAVERTHGWRVPPHLRAAAEPAISIEALLAPPVAAELGLALLGLQYKMGFCTLRESGVEGLGPASRSSFTRHRNNRQKMKQR